jgi:RsiW-degrading membrane proteinase PrsW (M82 family)
MSLYTLIAGIIPAFIWLAFWLREDALHPEPRWLVAACFIGGGVSVIAAMYSEKYVWDIISDQTVRYIIWAALEEIIKLIVVAVIALNSTYNDEPIDAMIYIITVALGFAAIENAIFITNSLSNGEIANSIALNCMRFVGANLVHIVSSAMIGFAWGYTMYRQKSIRVISLIAGIGGAIAIHALFNLMVVGSGSQGILRIFAVMWITVVILMILFEEIKVIKPQRRLTS